MKFEKYIHELLRENETVIIPGFGAFIANYKPAEVYENEIKPPSKEITFNRQIRNNDGLLVGFIAETEKISHFDALRFIEKERENIIYLLDKGEEVTLKETGVLFLNEKSEIQFRPEHDENLLLDSFGLEPVALSEEKPQEVEEIIIQEETHESEKVQENVGVETPSIEESASEVQEEQAKIEEGTVVETEQASEGISEVIENEDIKEELEVTENAEIIVKAEEETANQTNDENAAIESEPVSKVKTESAEIEEPVEETVTFEENIEEPEKPESPPGPEKERVLTQTEEPEERKKKGGWWFLLVLIPIIVAGFFIYKNQKKESGSPIKKETVVPEQNTPEIQQKQVLTDSTQNMPAEEQVQDSPKVSEDASKNIEVTPSDSLKFYLVGGGFKEEENAETYLNELKAKGLNPFHMGKRGNYYMIGIGKYKTEAEAVEARREYAENNPGSSAWILEEK